MRFKGMLAAAALATGMAGIASAQDAPPLANIIEMRQRIMLANEQSAAVIVAMLRNQIPYDATIVANLLSTIAHDNSIFPSLMVPGTETGTGIGRPDSNIPPRPTEVAPTLWANMADFQALSLKMAADAEAAAAAAAGDRNAFLAHFKTITDNCTACHEKYRIDEDN